MSRKARKAGLTEGMLIGEKRGMQIGKILTQTANVERLMKKQLSMQEAFDLLEIEEDMQEKIIKRITNDEKSTNEIKALAIFVKCKLNCEMKVYWIMRRYCQYTF